MVVAGIGWGWDAAWLLSAQRDVSTCTRDHAGVLKMGLADTSAAVAYRSREIAMDIGFLGRGSMGRPIARNRRKPGFRSERDNRTPAGAESVIECGGTEVVDAAESFSPTYR